MAKAGDELTVEAFALVRVRQAAMVTSQMVSALARPKRGRAGARTRWLGKSPTGALSAPTVAD